MRALVRSERTHTVEVSARRELCQRPCADLIRNYIFPKALHRTCEVDVGTCAARAGIARRVRTRVRSFLSSDCKPSLKTHIQVSSLLLRLLSLCFSPSLAPAGCVGRAGEPPRAFDIRCRCTVASRMGNTCTLLVYWGNHIYLSHFDINFYRGTNALSS
ncbi:hypothetical protein DFH11DRAFT_900781 [Phellopilus nigrolimitatus]|nr:hypothetical protein DFH11DRAFT_900781 [Phellopilus nigrolimitatus]